MSQLAIVHEKSSAVDHVKYIDIIVKISERCNLNCTYCYFFNLSDKSYKSHPAFVSQATVQDLIQFLKRSKESCPNLEYVRLDFHGGEPMLQPKHQFDAMCQNLKESLQGYFKLHFCMQTNATLVTQEWIQLLEKHRVSVSISLDGPEEINDEFRVDHHGKGSYKQTVQGLKLLQNAKMNGQVGLLCVINPARNPKVLYNHFVHDLGIKFIDFLFPDYTHDTFSFQKHTAEEYGEYICTLFDLWTAENNPAVTIRFLDSVMGVMLGQPPMFYGKGGASKSCAVLTIASNGEIGPVDTLRNADSSLMTKLGSIKDQHVDLAQILCSPFFQSLENALEKLPPDCRQCCWQNQCCGGDVLNRYSKKNHFANSSVFCSGLKMIYAKVARYLLDRGEKREAIFKSLKI
jgi:uncharacterized protein